MSSLDDELSALELSPDSSFDTPGLATNVIPSTPPLAGPQVVSQFSLPLTSSPARTPPTSPSKTGRSGNNDRTPLGSPSKLNGSRGRNNWAARHDINGTIVKEGDVGTGYVLSRFYSLPFI